jgi:hypothetical protein
MRIRLGVLLAIVLLMAPVASNAQQTGEIFGRVTDTSGGVMPGVTVTLTSPALLQPMVAITSETGTYQFPRLAIGLYTVRFELPGFKTVVREGVRIEIGFNAQINSVLEISALEETITVTGETPVVDLRDTSRGQRFTQESLQSVPSARDPWVILEQTAGIAMDRQNVGGSQSGQQSNYMARGAIWSQSKWNLDGVDITDQSALGASPVYYDFDMLEELQIVTGGSDASAQTAGVSVNIVTKTGTDMFKGSGRMYFTPEALESVNIDDTLRLQGARTGNPIQDIKDYGFEMGGPIKRGRAWYWGSFGKQDIKVGVEGFYKPTASCQEMKAALMINPTAYAVRDIWGCLETDLTTLNNYNGKVSVQLSNQNRFSAYANFAEKVRNARDASDLRPLETTYRQKAVSSEFGTKFWKTGIPSTYKFSDQHIFTDRFMAEIAYAHVGNNFALDFHKDELTNVQPGFEITTGLWSRSYQQWVYVRPFDSIDLTANYFLPGVLGGDHSFKAGYRWRQGMAHNVGHWGGNTVARFNNGVPTEAQMYRDAVTKHMLYTQSFYLQDTFTLDRLTLNLGFRWDRQTDETLASSVGAHPFQGQAQSNGDPFNWLPGISFGGAQAGIVFNDISPRLGMTYDLLGDGRTVVKGNYARYYSQISTGDFSSVYNPVTTASIRLPWTDLNGDGLVQPNELDPSRILTFTGNYDPYNPDRLDVRNSVDPNLTNDYADELTVSLDRQVAPDFAVGASYIYRKYQNFRWSPRDGLTSDKYVQRSFEPTGCPAGAQCETVTYWEPTIPWPATYTYTNRPDYYRDFNGFEVTARKRMSGGWMMTSSFAYNDAKQHFPTPASYTDPTNIEKWHGASYAPETSASGIDNVFVEARWMFKLTGAYKLPWQEIGIAGFYNSRQGYPVPLAIQSPNRANQAGRTNLLLDKLGETRLPTYQNIDLRIDKPFTLFNRLKVQASMDIFNLMNSNTVLAQRRIQNASNANNITQILAPRVIRIGFRTMW